MQAALAAFGLSLSTLLRSAKKGLRRSGRVLTEQNRMLMLALAVVLPLATGCESLVGADFDQQGKSTSAGNGESSDGTTPAEGADGGSPAMSTDDASARTCRGTALACAAFVDSAACSAQTGCAWTAKTCGGAATDCATNNPNVCYIRQPACEWDFDFRQCEPSPSWCQTTSESTCTSRAGCFWTGGCSGQAKACTTISTSSCATQKGCSVVGG